MPATTATTTAAMPWMDYILIPIGIAFILIMGALCLLLLIKMWKNEINLCSVLQEANGQASMSRFQLLIFTLVIAVGVFLYILHTLSLPDIPSSVLTLLGISASTYAAGKGITFSRPEGLIPQPDANCPPENPPAPTGSSSAPNS